MGVHNEFYAANNRLFLDQKYIITMYGHRIVEVKLTVYPTLHRSLKYIK